ncbi:MAG TPA: regulatory protein RecX [Ruminococcaceae bacterium]|nr:regulatory protein RecX [Oscillospiraceae bacterium]
MRITAIKPRRKSLSAIYIDGEFAVNLDTKTLLENRVDVGLELDDEKLHRLIKLSDESRAKEKALWLISYRSHSKKELTDKIRRTVSAEAAEKAAERMEELGLVNDEDFARRCADKLIFTKKMSKRAAKAELARKGIDRELSERVLDEIDVDYREQITEFLLKKYKNLGDEKVKRRAFAALQRLGYGSDDIRRAMRSLEE